MLAGMFGARTAGGPPPGPDIYAYTAATNMAVYDPSDLATLFQDSAGTTPVTADGDPVGLILDQAGNSARDMMQASTGERPIYRTSSGKHWLENDGTKWMYSRGNDALAFSVVNVFTGARKSSGFSDYGVLIGHPHDTTHSSPFFRWDQSGLNSGGQTLYIVSESGGLGSTFNYPEADVGLDFILTCGINSMYAVAAGAQQRNHLRLNKAIKQNGGTADTTSYVNSNKSTLMANQTGIVPWKGDFYGGIVYGVAVTSIPWIDAAEEWINDRLRVPV